MLLPTHIAAGGLALVLGALALAVKKGGALHCGAGSVRLVRCSRWQLRGDPRNVGGGLMTITSWGPRG